MSAPPFNSEVQARPYFIHMPGSSLEGRGNAGAGAGERASFLERQLQLSVEACPCGSLDGKTAQSRPAWAIQQDPGLNSILGDRGWERERENEEVAHAISLDSQPFIWISTSYLCLATKEAGKRGPHSQKTCAQSKSEPHTPCTLLCDCDPVY